MFRARSEAQLPADDAPAAAMGGGIGAGTERSTRLSPRPEDVRGGSFLSPPPSEGSMPRRRRRAPSYSQAGAIPFVLEDVEQGSATGGAGAGTATRSFVPRTLEDRRRANNTMFGFKPWKVPVSKRASKVGRDDPTVLVSVDLTFADDFSGHLNTADYGSIESGAPLPTDAADRLSPSSPADRLPAGAGSPHYAGHAFSEKGATDVSFVSPGNIFYLLLCGWWTSLIYFAVGCILTLLIFPRSYGNLCLCLGRYFAWPFGKYLERRSFYPPQKSHHPQSQSQPQQQHSQSQSPLPKSDSSSGLLDEASNSTGAAGASATPAAKRSMHSPEHSFSLTTLFGWFLWLFIGLPILLLTHILAWVICWFFVILIPMAKVNAGVFALIVSDPLTLSVGTVFPPPASANLLLCAFAAVNKNYLKHTVDGMNVVLVNLLPFAVASLVMGWILSEEWRHEHVYLVFGSCLIAIVPLAYYIGHSVASISAQCSFAVGAVLNATFGSVIELIIYVFSISKGLTELALQGVTGSLIGAMLLLPGLCMVAGGLRHNLQYFNQNAAGVSAVMLLLAVLGDFTPSLFFQLYRGHNDKHDGNITNDLFYQKHAKPLLLFCACVMPVAYLIGLIFTLKTHKHFYQDRKKDKVRTGAKPEPVVGSKSVSFAMEPSSVAHDGADMPGHVPPSDGAADTAASAAAKGDGLHRPGEVDDPSSFKPAARAATAAVAVAVAVAEDGRSGRGNDHMGVHATVDGAAAAAAAVAAATNDHDDDDVEEDAEGAEDDVAGWSIRKCVMMLVVSTAMFAMVAETMTDSIGVFLEEIGMSQRFAGLTIIAIVPNIAELVNAIIFAYQNNITLALEIGNVAAIQIALIQIPFLVFVSYIFPGSDFAVIFQSLDVFAVFVCVVIVSYISIDGRCNYFEGTALLLIYIILLGAFYNAPD